MALNWDATEVLDYDILHEDHEGMMMTQACVFTCMYIGMGAITPANWQKWFIRAHIWERVVGSYLYQSQGNGKPVERIYIGVQDVIRRIGLRTNAQTYSDTQFRQKVFDIQQGQAIEEMQQEDVQWLNQI